MPEKQRGGDLQAFLAISRTGRLTEAVPQHGFSRRQSGGRKGIWPDLTTRGPGRKEAGSPGEG
jgi:hypothetical protein